FAGGQTAPSRSRLLLKRLRAKPLIRSRARSLEQLRRELVQVVLPVDPGVAALAFLEDRVQAQLLQQIHRLAGLVEQEILRAGAEPEHLQALLRPGVVELALILLFPVVHAAE